MKNLNWPFKGLFFHLIEKFSSHWLDFFNIIYPELCLNCHKNQASPDEPVLCGACRALINYQDVEKIGDSFKSTDIYKFYSLGYYEGIIRDLIIKFKYHKKTKLANYFAEEINKRILVKLPPELIKKIDFIIPIPLHENKKRERGFNQSELIAKALSELINIPVYADIIIRCRETKPQKALNIDERFENLASAFSLKPEKKLEIKNKNVIIIDDILTTGATIGSVAKLMKKNGTADIVFITVARTK